MVTASLPSFNEALSDTFYDSLPSHEPDNGGAVEIDTGDGDVSAVLKYVVANAAYTKGLKSSPVWKYFAHFDAVQHPDKKNHRICLLCRELGIDKSISVGKDYSNTPLISHLQSKHKEEFKEFLAAKNSTAPQSGSSQAQIGSFFSKKSEIKEKFKRYFAKFVVDECLPLTICRSPSLKDMVRCINKHVDVPSYQSLITLLHSLRLAAGNEMKSFMKGKYFSITTDHWTSFAKENYGAITLHLIHDFKLFSFVLSCTKHENGCSGIEMERQLLADIDHWDLDKSCFVCCVTDSASNMNYLGERMEAWRDAPYLRHHYCADHILQRTAVLAFSGNIPSPDPEDPDISVSAVRKARDLVSYVNSSVLATEKIRAKQAQDPDCTVFKLLSDVETRWWSTHTLVERVLKLKDTLVDVFANEFRFRDSPNQLTALEKLQLTDDDFLALSDVLTLLTPFRDSQKALEGELYVSISLLPLVVHHLSHELMVLQGSVDPDYQGTLFELITKMKDDFESRWGTRVQYFSTTQRSSRRRQSGLPTYSFWAMALDPRTKKMIPKILSANDVQLLWKDILDAVLEVAQSSSSYIDPVPPVAAAEGQAPRNNKKRVAQFLVDYLDTEEETIDVVQEQLSLEVRVSREVELFKLCHGCSLTCTEGSYVDPLQWWKENYKIYPNVWLVAIRILCIPATSAPAERVFSAASNLVNKKRIRLHPDSVDLLIYLRANSKFVDWGVDD